MVRDCENFQAETNGQGNFLNMGETLILAVITVLDLC